MQQNILNSICLVSAARMCIKSGVALKYESEKRTGSITFETESRGGFNPSRKFKAPEKWFLYMYNKLKLCNIKLYIPETVEKPDIKDNAFDEPRIICFFENGSVSAFTCRSKYNSDTKLWDMYYSEAIIDNSARYSALYMNNKDGLAAVLEKYYNWLRKVAPIDTTLLFNSYHGDVYDLLFAVSKSQIADRLDSDRYTFFKEDCHFGLSGDNYTLTVNAILAIDVLKDIKEDLLYGKIYADASLKDAFSQIVGDIYRNVRCALMYAVNAS